jgi:hypothetical protein
MPKGVRISVINLLRNITHRVFGWYSSCWTMRSSDSGEDSDLQLREHKYMIIIY